LAYKYANDLFCNEIMLLPYYIASLNIEHAYYERTGEYRPFEGICFADTLELAEGRQLPLFVEENTERVQREKAAQIMVVIGNPPYNVGQKSENDNNKNRKYPIIDQRIRETYAKDSKATNRNALSDAYVKFFRWAADRLGNRDGIVCLVTNNSFIDQIAFDGMRKHLQNDFEQIYHIDLHGNVRKNPKLSGTAHNVFGIQIGVGITIAVHKKAAERYLKYYRVPEYWHKTEKLTFLREKANISNIDWRTLQTDNTYNWITQGLQPEFSTFPAMGRKVSNPHSAVALDGFSDFW
jgi:predicted helicase